MMFTVALLQMTYLSGDPQASLDKGEAFCRRAAALGADLALFPELWNCGHGKVYEAAALAAQSVPPEGPFHRRHRDLARELGLAIAFTCLERRGVGFQNVLHLVDRRGRPVLRYAKVHTCAFDWEGLMTPGDGFPVATLETASGPVRLGAMICYDREFPESARMLMLNGAEVVLVPNACRLEANRLTQLRARAFENVQGLAVANYASPQENGHSVAFDGRAFTGPDGETRDHCVAEAGEGEEVLLAPFDLEAMRAYRAQERIESWRRPGAYRGLAGFGPEGLGRSFASRLLCRQ